MAGETMKKKKSKNSARKINALESVLVIILIFLVIMMMISVSRIQGMARVVNYAGIVRGATQRLVKLEISGDENQELEEYLDEIIAGLKDGSDDLNLVRLDNKDYQTKLTELSAYWEDLKDELELVRGSKVEATDVIDMSETYFELADNTVSAAEVYAQRNVTYLRTLEILLAIVIAGMILLMIKEAVEAFSLMRTNRSLNQKAYIDQHTGLPNKSRCEEIFKDRTFITNPTSCVMFDMNGLKTVNDTLGHVAGDTLIENFATIIRNTIPERYFVGRYGGDEFVAVITDATEQEVTDIIRDVEAAVQRYNEYRQASDEPGIALSFASGYSISTSFTECTMQTILDKADQNMYRNKKIMLEKSLESRMEMMHAKMPDEEKSMMALVVSNLSKNKVTRCEVYNGAELPPADGITYDDHYAYTLDYIFMDSDREAFRKLHQREYLLNHFSEGSSILTIEYQLKRKNGKLHWARNVLNLITDPRSKDVLLYEYCYDIHRIKNIEKMMHFSVSDEYDLIGNVNFQDGNASLIYGINSFKGKTAGSEYADMDYTECVESFAQAAIPDDEREAYLEKVSLKKVQKILSEQESFEFSCHMIKNGQTFTKKMRYTRDNADPNCCMFTQSDITSLIAEEKKKQSRLESALKQAKDATQAKTAFLSRMSHDIRTPMNTIIGMSALARDEIDNPAAIDDYLMKIDTAGKFLLGLVNDCLDLEKIESNKMVLKSERYPYRDFLNAIRTMFIPLCQAKNIEFQIEEGSIACDIYTDRVRFEQIFFNLLSNAVKYTPEGGKVSFHAMKGEIHDGILSRDFEVRDNGIGMSVEFQKKMFDPFEQESNTIVAQAQGSGLGLAIVKNIVEMMGGTLKIESREGWGTTAVVHLDMKIAEKSQTEKPDTGSISLDVLSGKRVLLFEDHPLNTEITTKLLKKKGVFVVCAVNGKEGLDIFSTSQEHYFDCILMDIRMPVMNGLDAARAIRALDREDAENIPIIAMSANAYQEDVQQSLDAGMNAHLTKPIEPKKFYETLAEYVR